MEFRAHGANPEKLYELAGIQKPAKIYDFSTNTNAVPQRAGFVPDLRAALEDYPDGDCLALREALAREFGVPAENILVSSGSNEAIYIIASYAAARENLILQPVYGEYKKALDGYGARTRNIFSLAEAEGARGAAVWLCNPCNPTGALIPGAELDAAAERNPGTIFIIDEAYRDFVWTEELPVAVKIHPNVVRLRSLTKIYDLCGARVGALVSHEAAVEKIKARQPEWSVSGLAQQAALWRAGDETLKARTREYYAREIPRLTAALREAGSEYGAKTGRPRRVGPIDLVATRYGVRLQGATCLALTKLDVLGYMDKIPLCVAYEVDGTETRDFPFPAALEGAKPVLEYMDGWGCDISKARKWTDLPLEARRYVRRIEQESGCPIRWVSVGAGRDEYIRL